MREIGPAMRTILTPVAEHIGIENYDREMVEPEGGEKSKALHLVACGAWILTDQRDPNSFPGASPKACKRGAKYIDRSLGNECAGVASIFLSRAFAAYMGETMYRAGHPEQVAYQEAADIVLAERVSLQDEYIDAVDAARAEYRRLDTREPPPEPANGWHMALLGSGNHDPDDPELLEVQLRYAEKFFRLEVVKTAIKIVLSERHYAKVEEDFLLPEYSLGLDAMKWDVASSSSWLDTAKKWREAIVL